MFPIRTILCPTDFSPTARAALETAESLAAQFHAKLVLVHVVPPPHPLMMEGLLKNYEYDPEAMGNCLKAITPSDPRISFERVLLEGDPVAKILREAETRHCDLIVIGTHGRRGVGRFFLGSVAEKVVRQATCPVLTVKPPLATLDASLTEAEAALTS